MSDPQRPLKVFLSYASQDKPIVRELSRRLVGEGWIDTWLDEKNLLPGHDWRLKIEEAVEDSDIVIICLSSNSVTKEGYVQKELRYAREMALEKPEETIFLIPLRLDDCEVPRGLRFYQWVDYFGEKRDESYDALVESLKLRYEQKLRLEEAERAQKEKLEAERIAREEAARKKAKKDADEKARLEAEEKERQRIAKEKVDREAAEKAAREKADREAAEKAAKEKELWLDRLYTEGLAAFYTEDWDKAEKHFQSVLKEQPNNKNVVEKLGEMKRRKTLREDAKRESDIAKNYYTPQDRILEAAIQKKSRCS